ncbi:MAG: hypothetical protein JWO82_3073, partial [Akkermansiaceae bacterium]|nr:hypothetical protein [Akkermansiaceae bacterium]
MKKRFMPRRKDGFTLIITIMLMTMLTLLSIGMLTLGAVTLRGGSVAENKRTANANAQMALMFAIGELQKQLGDDRRVTADASILKSGSSTTEAAQAHMVGVWTSDNPYAETTTQVASISAPKYDKTTTFKKWLISSPKPSETEELNFGTGGAPSGPTLFSTEMDGYEITSEPVPILSGDNKQGAFAWAVSQENTKAKINVGTDFDRSTYNMSVQAPTRPDLKVGQVIKKQPTDGWVDRNGKVISMSQAVLDPGFGIEKDQLKTLGPDYTATAQGVLADVAKGRLKTDLSLAFEMSQSDYKKSKWGAINNPFAEGAFGDTPLFTPNTGTGSPLTYPVNYGAVTYQEVFFASAPPTFGTLRSYYRMYRHLYNAGGGGSVTAFQRPQASNYWTATGGYPAQIPTDGGGNNTSVGPILDRMLMVLCEYVTPSGQAAIVISPIITLWNPYNTGIDVDGMVAYPFMDIPSFYTFYKNGVPDPAGERVMSQLCGLNIKNNFEGRQQEPYFYCQITNDGSATMGTPIHFAAGEVKVFQPVSSTPVLFNRGQALSPNAPSRVIPMMPVTASAPVTKVRGGIAYAINQAMQGGAGLTVGRSDTLQLKIDFRVGSGSDYRYGIALEDSTRIRNKYANNIEKAARFWNEIHVLPNPSAFIPITSPNLPSGPMTTQPQVVTVIESYHRTELPTTGTTTTADLLLSSNPRQRYQHPNLAPTTTFKNGTGPHYETHMRRLSSFADLNLQTSADGTRSYYGASNNSSSGKDYLSLFDLPREPQMSIGAFQNAELTDL